TLADVLGKMRRLEFADGDTIIRQGEAGDLMFLIRRGVVEVLRDSGQGPQRLALLDEGKVFGERALLTEEPRNATVVARGPVLTYVLHKTEFLEAKKENATFREQLTMVAAARQE